MALIATKSAASSSAASSSGSCLTWDVTRCMARMWHRGAGSQCLHRRPPNNQDLCETHQTLLARNGTLPQGRVDGENQDLISDKEAGSQSSQANLSVADMQKLVECMKKAPTDKMRISTLRGLDRTIRDHFSSFLTCGGLFVLRKWIRDRLECRLACLTLLTRLPLSEEDMISVKPAVTAAAADSRPEVMLKAKAMLNSWVDSPLARSVQAPFATVTAKSTNSAQPSTLLGKRSSSQSEIAAKRPKLSLNEEPMLTNAQPAVSPVEAIKRSSPPRPAVEVLGSTMPRDEAHALTNVQQTATLLDVAAQPAASQQEAVNTLAPFQPMVDANFPKAPHIEPLIVSNPPPTTLHPKAQENPIFNQVTSPPQQVRPPPRQKVSVRDATVEEETVEVVTVEEDVAIVASGSRHKGDPSAASTATAHPLVAPDSLPRYHTQVATEQFSSVPTDNQPTAVKRLPENCPPELHNIDPRIQAVLAEKPKLIELLRKHPAVMSNLNGDSIARLGSLLKKSQETEHSQKNSLRILSDIEAAASRSITISRLPPEATYHDVEALFDDFGPVEIDLPRESRKKKHVGIAHVTMMDAREAHQAVRAIHGCRFRVATDPNATVTRIFATLAVQSTAPKTGGSGHITWKNSDELWEVHMYNANVSVDEGCRNHVTMLMPSMTDDARTKFQDAARKEREEQVRRVREAMEDVM